MTELPAAASITQDGNSVRIAVADVNLNTCLYSGPLSQGGQMGSAEGTLTCADNSSGSFTISELQVNPLGVTFRITSSAQPSGCATRPVGSQAHA